MSSGDILTQLNANPTDWDLRAQYVEALVAEDRHDAAVQAVNDGQAQGIPHEAGPWLAAAKCYAAVGAVEQAKQLAGSSLQLDPDYLPAQNYLAELNGEAPVEEAPAAEEAVPAEEEEVVVAVAAEDEIDPVAAQMGGYADETVSIASADSEAAAGIDPFALPTVEFSAAEMEELHEREAEAKRRREAAINKDRVKAVAVTILIHALLLVLILQIVSKAPPNAPPGVVAMAPPATEDDTVETEEMKKPTPTQTQASSASVTNMVSVNAVSDFAVSDVTVEGLADVSVSLEGMSFQPSMTSLSVPSSSESKMMFGQPIDGNVLGVILDVSGSMAEFLPQVVREVDKNFENAPIVYVKNMLLRPEFQDEATVRLIVPEEVIPKVPYEGRMMNTPYWFLWNDLPRKAPQRYVDRLIETFKTRPNSFLAVTDHDRSGVREAIDFLMEQKVDSLYIFSDYEDFVDEEVALEVGQKLGRRKIKTYVQPAERGTEFLDAITSKLVNRTRGRQLPSLTAIRRGSLEDVELAESDQPAIENVMTYASPRTEMLDGQPFSWRPRATWQRIKEVDTRNYTALFYGPESQAAIYLKNNEGEYIQEPIRFYWHSWKEFPDHPDPAFRRRHRKFLRADEPIVKDDEFQWNMVLEDELKMQVRLYLKEGGMTATYTADLPTDGTNDACGIHFRIPELASEKNDMFFGYDLPGKGAKLEQVRIGAMPNYWTMELPRELRDTFGKQWAQRGFEPGEVTRKFNELVREYPPGIREITTQGPSFAERVIRMRTTSKEVLLKGWGTRRDSEGWEGYSMHFRRPDDRRTGFRKSEAIEIEIQ